MKIGHSKHQSQRKEHEKVESCVCSIYTYKHAYIFTLSDMIVKVHTHCTYEESEASEDEGDTSTIGISPRQAK